MNEKKRILVVDDEPDTLTTLFDLLTSEGYSVATASDGCDALSILERVRPDLVICDMRMPGFDGMEVLVRIRRMKPEANVIFLTAYGTDETARLGAEAGARELILKPFRNHELLATIRRVLNENPTPV